MVFHDVRINFLAQLTKRSFNLHNVARRTSTLTLSGRLRGNLPILDIILFFNINKHIANNLTTDVQVLGLFVSDDTL